MTAIAQDEAPPVPECQCCGGDGMHYWYAYAGGKSPEDKDAECDTCAGSGKSRSYVRPGTCSGARSLRRPV
jgi:hypothetical protein